MIREALFDQITKIIDHLYNNLKKNGKENITRFFYEKAVRDRNHGVLSAISLLKIHEESDEKEPEIKEKGILEAAIAIACHDEDIWEALCGCQGYLRSSGKMPSKENDCFEKCRRGTLLWPAKKSRIFEEKISDKTTEAVIDIARCESWEREIMKERIIRKIKFKDNPILFLLTFCDNIQDEGRITSSDKEMKVTSSYKQVSRDRSTLENIDIEKKDDKIRIMINLKSDDQENKEEEIERLAWCLEDDRFTISINKDSLKEMNGSGG